MKKIAKILTFFSLVVLLTMLGCKKDDTTSVNPQTVDTGTFKAYINNVQVNSIYTVEILTGDTVRIGWNYTGKSSFEIKLNGEPFSSNVTGQVNIPVTSNLTFIFLIQEIEQKTKVVITATTLPPPPTRLDTLCGDWQLVKQYVRFGQVGPLHEVILQSCEKCDTLRLKKDGWCYLLQGVEPCFPNLGHILTQGTYTLSPDGKKIISGSAPSDIDTLTYTKMVLHDTIPGAGSRYDDSYFWYTKYAYAKKK